MLLEIFAEYGTASGSVFYAHGGGYDQQRIEQSRMGRETVVAITEDVLNRSDTQACVAAFGPQNAEATTMTGGAAVA